MKAQVLCHPDLIPDSNGAVSFAVACVGKASILEFGRVPSDAFIVRNGVLFFGLFPLGGMAKVSPESISADSDNDKSNENKDNE